MIIDCLKHLTEQVVPVIDGSSSISLASTGELSRIRANFPRFLRFLLNRVSNTNNPFLYSEMAQERHCSAYVPIPDLTPRWLESEIPVCGLRLWLILDPRPTCAEGRRLMLMRGSEDNPPFRNYASTAMWRDSLRRIPPIGFFLVESRDHAGPGWTMPRARPHASWLRQVDSCLKNAGVTGLASAWATVRRRPRE